MNLEKRMYFFVPYNISPIQQAIQAGHAALEYARKYQDDEEFIDFANNWKTWIILNGGTTNSKIRKDVINIRDTEDPYIGNLDNLYVKFILWNIKHKDDIINHTIFQELDLNDALTAVCFICDERVFNYEDYPDFAQFILDTDIDDTTKEHFDRYQLGTKLYRKSLEELITLFPDQYVKWTTLLGGEKNVFLRNLLRGKKLA